MADARDRQRYFPCDAGWLPWRLLPSDLPPWGTSYRWFAKFRDDGLLEKINHSLVMADRRPASTAAPIAAERRALAVSGAAVGCRGRASGRRNPPRHHGDHIMTAALAIPATRRTRSWFIFSAQAWPTTDMWSNGTGRLRTAILFPPRRGPQSEGRGKAKHMVVSRKQAEAMRPGRTEIIICTGLSTRGGRQAWGSVAAGILCDRKQKG